MWGSSACATCEYHDSDFDELTNREDDWCEIGHGGLKGFPFQKKPRCYVECTWKVADKEYWETKNQQVVI